MLYQKTKRLFIVSTLSLIACLASSLPTHAEKAKIHLQISPVEQKMDLNPGETKTGIIKVKNIGADPFDYEMSSAPYQVKDEKYEADNITRNEYTRISEWIKFPKPKGRLLPDQMEEVEFVVTAPYDSPGGGQYAAIFASTSGASSQKDAIHTTQSAGMKLLARVSGVTRKSGKILDHKVDSFLFNPPIKASSLVESTSNVDIAAKYDFQIYNFFTGSLAYSNEFDNSAIKEKNLLPNTKFLSESSWEGAPRIGVFRVKYRVNLLNDSIYTEKIVIICPMWLLFMILTIFFLSVFWVISRIKARRATAQVSRY